MKKFIYIFIFIFVFMFVNITGVEAVNLAQKDVSIECIYSDGGVYTIDYDSNVTGKLEKYYINRSNYNVSGVDYNSSMSGTNYIIIGSELYRLVFLSDNSIFTCPGNLYGAQTAIPYNYGNTVEEKPINIYKLGEKINKEEDLSDYCNGEFLCKFVAIGAYSDEQKYSLLSERYYISGDYEPDATIYYVATPADDENKCDKSSNKIDLDCLEQASNTKEYIKIMVYENIVLLEKNNKITRIAGNIDTKIFKDVTRNDDNSLSKEVPKVLYLNSPEPIAKTNSSSLTSYRFNEGQTVYSISDVKDTTHIYRYELTDEVEDIDNNKDGELCDKILPKTSDILRNVIKAMQILIPVFLIVLTAIDIGKVVVAGNIDEELPKRKKIIIIRFVVVLVFFFLPVFVRMITGWLINSGGENTDKIKYIDCLFR